MFKKIIQRYLILFVLFYVGYSLLNRLFTGKAQLVTIDKDYTNFWGPFVLIYIPLFFYLRPLVKKSGFKVKAQDAWLWVLFPFSISVPTAISQPYFKDMGYRMVSVDYPEDVLAYPKEKFFTIRDFWVKNDGFNLYKERHVSGYRSKTLKVNNYYLAPMFGKNNVNGVSKIGYGIKFSTSLNHGLLFRDNQPQKIQEFNKKTAEEFSNYDLYAITFFEKQMASEDATQFAYAWKQNDWLDSTAVPVVLVAKKETFKQMMKKERSTAVYAVIISLVVTLGLFSLFEFFSK